MQSKYNITQAELPIMKALWQSGELTSPQIFEGMDGNINTLKTLLKRLVNKGAVATVELNARTYLYRAVVSKADYTNYERRGFLQRVFDGSKEKMLLNFVREENITRRDLEELLDLIEED